MSIRILAAFLFLSLAVSAIAAERSVIVLDASGSMWGQIGGRAKIEIARQALSDVLGALPAETELGLIVYGHREKGNCSDIELAVAPAAATVGAITDFAAGIRPKGKTPLTEAVRRAASTLASSEERATVILLTDGVETCEADPCALGRELAATGVGVKVHVIGFDLSAEEGARVSCLAETTGGRYIEAGDAARLSEALRATVAVAPEPEPESAPVDAPLGLVATAALAEDGPDFTGGGLRWDLFALAPDGEPEGRSLVGAYEDRFTARVAPGRYLLRVRLGQVRRERILDVTDRQATAERLVLDAARLSVVPKRRADDAEPDDEARVDVAFPGGRDGGYGARRFYVAAGEVTITGRIGKAEVEEVVRVAPGESLERLLVIGSGVVAVTADYATGGPAVESRNIRFTVQAARPGIDGKRKDVAGRHGAGQLDIPAGEYVLHARLGKAESVSEPFEVVAGERVAVAVGLDAGVLAVTAPGAHRIDIHAATADIQGRRRHIAGGRGDTFQETLPAGQYQIRVAYKSDRAAQERDAAVAAGERVEIRVD